MRTQQALADARRSSDMSAAQGEALLRGLARQLARSHAPAEGRPRGQAVAGALALDVESAFAG
jgi:hypothetical protein